MPKLKEVLSKEGLIELLIKCTAFILFLIFLMQFIVWKEEVIAVNEAWFSLNIMGFGTNTPIRLVLFLVLSFVLLSKNKILDMPKFKFKIISFAIFFSLSIVFAYLLRIFRFTIADTPSLITQYFWPLLCLKFLMPVLILASLFLAVFQKSTLAYFWKKLRTESAVSLLFTFVFFQLSNLFQKIWPYMSRAVVESVSVLLSFTFSDITKNLVNPDMPGLSVNNINIIIGKPCSGIDSQVLFLFLFSIILLLDWHEINKKRVFSLIIPGMIGMFGINILRIYLLYLMAIYISVDFALSAFHSNIGWILFVLYFVAFEYFSYSWVTKWSFRKKF